jgi:hypothetical protein
MAATGFTPIQLYYSVTTTNVPLAANLAYGELAINVTDGKLYYKSPSGGGTVKVLADGAVATGNLPGGSAGTVVYQSATGVTAYLTLGTSGYILTSNGTGPAYVNPASLTVGVAATAGFATTAGSATTATTATNATNIANGLANQIVYQTGVGATSFAAAPTTTGTVLGWTGSAFAWVAAPAASSASNIAGGAQYQIPFQSGVSATTFSANLLFNSATNTLSAPNVSGTNVSATKTITAAANSGAFNYGTLNFSDTNIVTSAQTSVNSYFQSVIQNTSNGNFASSEFVAYNDTGTATTNYAAFGINSTGYTGTGAINAPNNAFALSGSSDMVVGTIGANYLRLVTNSNAADSVTIAPTNAVAFNGNYGVAGQVLQSNGTSGAPTWINTSTLGTSKAFVYFMSQS